MHLEGLAETLSKGDGAGTLGLDGTGAPFPANREATRSREMRVSFKSRCEGLWLPGEAVGGLRSGPLSQLPGGRSWDLRSGGQLGGGEQWPAEMERAGQNRTSRAAGWRGGGVGGRSWTSSRGRGLLGQVSEAGAQGPSPGGFQECAQRREWAVGNATLLGPKPVEAARPDGPPRRGHGAHEAGQGKPGSPFLHPSPPARNFFV